MINTKELKKLLIEKDLKMSDIAMELNRSYSCVLLKINGKTPMTLGEAEKLQELLEIEDKDFGFYFLYKGIETNDYSPYARRICTY